MSSPSAEPAATSRSWKTELAIIAILFVASSLWATHFWNTWTARGGQPVFYQNYFEPAVMIACGRGFVITMHQPEPLAAFLQLRSDAFDCATLPAQLELDPDHVYQAAWRYLETTVGWAWRVLGISWSGLGPLFGVLFGAVIALAYGISRLAMGRVFAALGAIGLAASSIHLLNLPHLRDYAKAPFTLGLVLILGVIVTRPVRARSLLAWSAAYGAVLGIGYGFRTDFLAAIPVLVIVLFGFLDGGIARHVKLKVASTALFLATFIVVSWPITTAVVTKGGCQWHVALLGLQAPLDPNLSVGAAPYDFGYAYSDEYISRTVSGYAYRMDPGQEPLVFCGPEYDLQSGRYLLGIVSAFPGDVLTRASASVLQLVELPFRQWSAPMTDWLPYFYRLRAFALQPGVRWGAYFTAAAILVTSAVSLRLGLFLVFFLAYFGGYPAVQFQERHFFHLEFMGWWAIGFIGHHSVTSAWSLRSRVPDLANVRRGAIAAGAFAAAVGVLFVSVLGLARWYQAHEARQLFEAYLAAPKVPLPGPDGPLAGIAPTAWPQMIEVDLNQVVCGPRPTITFRYTALPAETNFTRTISLARKPTADGLTRVFLPVFDHFDGVEVSDTTPGCFVGVSRMTEPSRFPLLMGVTLPPDWRTLPLHQRLADRERDPFRAASGSPVVSLLMKASAMDAAVAR